MQNGVKQDPTMSIKLRATFLKVSSSVAQCNPAANFVTYIPAWVCIGLAIIKDSTSEQSRLDISFTVLLIRIGSIRSPSAANHSRIRFRPLGQNYSTSNQWDQRSSNSTGQR